jgi:hypothetical protein
MEKKLTADTEIKKQYISFMQEYTTLGHMEKIHNVYLTKPHYFIPHHYVLKPDSTATKLRVVFDASSKTT